MSKTGFDEVRKVPRERASVFAPELQLVTKLKQATEEVKASARLPDDTFMDALNKIYPNHDMQIVAAMRESIKKLRHLADLDPAILVIAANYYVRYPNGFNLNPNPQMHKLGRSEVAVTEFDQAAVSAIGDKRTPENIARVKADILAYYYMLTSN